MTLPNPPPLQSPAYQSRDPDDPLSPDHLRNLSLSATQAIRAYDIINRIARHPENEPGWPKILEDIQSAKEEVQRNIRSLRRVLSDKIEVKSLILRGALPRLGGSYDLETIATIDAINGQIREIESELDAQSKMFFELDRRKLISHHLVSYL